MGCASSKLDDLPAVALCRERCSFLDEAIHYRYVLAESHLAYSHSLKAVGLSLLRFFDHHLDNSTAAPTSPLLNLTTHRKLDPGKHSSPPHSNSGSHLQFHSDSDDSVSESPLHHDHYSENTLPVNPYGQINYADYETLSSYSRGGEFMNMNYMKNNSTPSVTYQQPPVSSETLQIGESSSSSYSYYSNQNPNYGYGSGINGFFGSPPAPVGPVLANSEASKPPPPPPPPPSSSPWDFLYPFVSFENYYPPCTPSRDSKEVRDEEGIPDLEDDHYHHHHHHHQEEEVVVKEVHGHQKLVEGGGKNFAAENYDDGNVNDFYRTKQPSASVNKDPVEFEVHVVDKKVVEEERPNVANTAAFKAQDDSDVLREIQVQFDRASESGNEFAKLLEIGKLPHKKNYVSSMLNVIKPSVPVVSSQPSTSKNPELSSNIDKDDLAYLEIDEDVEARSGNLSSTLHKLYLWEKKLYEEVKVEEKMRVLHERKSHKLKRLDERGAEAHKVDATRTLVRSLSTKIRIAIQVVDKISVKINKLRDEVLWPQLKEFIQGLTGMWKAMLECHHSQCQALGQAKRLDAVTSREHFSDAHLEATLQLEHELISWTLRFSCWVGAQKGYVRALNNWLLKCLLYVPEETSDGIVPFSPGRIGAPTVFIICNQWSQALEKISEKEVVDSMRDFATSLLQLWEQDKQEMCQRMMANKDMERKVKILDREDQKLQKEIRALDKSIVLASGDGIVSGHVVYQSDTSKTGSLQVSLQRIFEAMERFTASSLRAHEELLQRIEEDRLARDNEKVS